ncbi:MAG: oligosaccharide flippase family protein [Polyangiaceae bacterium]
MIATSGPLRSKVKSLLDRVARMGGRNALLYTVTTVLSRGAVLVLAPLYTRKLAPADYGDIALAQTLVSVVPTFVSLGLLAALSRFFFEGADAKEGIARAGHVARWIVALGLGAALFLQALVFVLPLPHTGLFQARNLSCIVWGATGSLLIAIPLVVLRSAQRAAFASAIQLVDFAVNLGSALILVAWLGRGFQGALEATGIAGCVSTLVGSLYVFRAMPGRLDRAEFRRALVFALPYVPHFAANQLLLVSDRWLLKAFGFDGALGIYSLASQLAAPVTMVVLAWNEAVSPRVGESFRAGGIAAMRSEERTVVRSYLYLSGGVSAALVLASPIAILFFGAAYAKALWFLPGLCVVMILETFYYPYSTYLFFMDRTKDIPKITVVAGIVNVCCNLALIPLLGVPGAIVSRALGGGVRSAASAYWARSGMKRATA